jgi:hypothetical protein
MRKILTTSVKQMNALIIIKDIKDESKNVYTTLGCAETTAMIVPPKVTI